VGGSECIRVRSKMGVQFGGERANSGVDKTQLKVRCEREKQRGEFEGKLGDNIKGRLGERKVHSRKMKVIEYQKIRKGKGSFVPGRNVLVNPPSDEDG